MSKVTAEFGAPVPGSEPVHRHAAYAVVLDDKSRVLAVRWKQALFLPGGGSRLGESPEATVAREVLEEVGCEVTLHKHLGHAAQHFVASDLPHLGRFDFFSASVVRGAVGPAEHDALWLATSELAGRLFHESHEWAVRRALDGDAS
jgi:8-oxo-dGTP diphosphatase